ncbi:MAG: electron transport complex subunit RsxC [Clostridia bacterium]|nr:electron transport complex subunit RsxC [Clostridia bacterium]
MKDPFISGKPCRTKGGVHVPHHKHTAALETVALPTPEKVKIPMQMHIGAPCNPLVKVGDTVLVGQKIGDADAPFSAPIHASVSGTVTGVYPMTLGGGAVSTVVEITSDGKMEEAPLAPPTVTDRASFLAAVRESGLVGLGGAGFPTHIKLNVPKGKTVDTLLINAAECEPYLTGDHRTALEDGWDVLSGVYAIAHYLDIPRVLICVENNKPDAIAELRRIADSSLDEGDRVRVLSLRASYPQGAEKVLIRAATGRVVPDGGLPADAGCIVLNITGAATLARYLKTGMPLVSKRVTVDGDAIERPANVRVPIGTPIADVLAFCGLREEPRKVLMGGPMMGTALADTAVPLVKNNNGILALTEKGAAQAAPSACIRCGFCVRACPMGLSPLTLARAASAGDTDTLQKAGALSCMECGCCSYSCPASRTIVQNIRIGKGLLREKMKKERKG